MFGAPAASRSVTFSSLAASLSSLTASHCRRCPFSYQTARHRSTLPRGRVHRDPALHLNHRHDPASGRASSGQSRCFPAVRAARTVPVMRRGGVAGWATRGFVARWSRHLLRTGPGACGGGCRERVDLAGPPAVAARRDRNGVGELRAVRQLVGGGPAELEERADVPDADQIVAGPPGWPGSRGRGDGRVWRAAHALPLATTWSGGSAIIASAASARSWVPVGEREVVGVLDLVRVPCPRGRWAGASGASGWRRVQGSPAVVRWCEAANILQGCQNGGSRSETKPGGRNRTGS